MLWVIDVRFSENVLNVQTVQFLKIYFNGNRCFITVLTHANYSSMLRDSVYFTTLKSLDYNVVMTFRFNNNNNNSLVQH